MFRITEDPSSGSLVQYFAKITRMVLSCPLTRTWSVLWQHIVKHCTRLPDDGSPVIRNMLKHFFKYFVILIVSSVYIFVH